MNVLFIRYWQWNAGADEIIICHRYRNGYPRINDVHALSSLYVYNSNSKVKYPSSCTYSVIKHFMTFRPFKIRISENPLLIIMPNYSNDIISSKSQMNQYDNIVRRSVDHDTIDYVILCIHKLLTILYYY